MMLIERGGIAGIGFKRHDARLNSRLIAFLDLSLSLSLLFNLVVRVSNVCLVNTFGFEVSTWVVSHDSVLASSCNNM